METEVKELFIKIKGKDYPLKKTWAAMFEVEELTKKSEELSSLRFMSKMFYIYFRAGGSDLTYDQFMELINDDFDLLYEFNTLMGFSEEKKSDRPIDLGEIYGRVVRLGIAPDYFLHKMSVDAVVELLKADDERRKDEWERTRQQCFYSVAPYSDKVKQPRDLFPLPWDEKKEKKSKKLRKDQVDNKVKQAAKIIKKYG